MSDKFKHIQIKKNGVSNKEKYPGKSRNDNGNSFDKINSKNQKMNKTTIQEEKKVKKKKCRK